MASLRYAPFRHRRGTFDAQARSPCVDVMICFSSSTHCASIPSMGRLCERVRKSKTKDSMSQSGSSWVRMGDGLGMTWNC